MCSNPTIMAPDLLRMSDADVARLTKAPRRTMPLSVEPDGRHTPMPRHSGPYFVNGVLVTPLHDKVVMWKVVPTLEVPLRGQPLYLGTLACIDRETPYPLTADFPLFPARRPGHRWA